MNQSASVLASGHDDPELMPPYVPHQRVQPLSHGATGTEHRAGEPAGDRHQAFAQQVSERCVQTPDVHADADATQLRLREVERDPASGHAPLPGVTVRPFATATVVPASQKKM